MNAEMRVCPHCGAYVMSGDNICPRCDYNLNQPLDDAARVQIESVEAAEPVEVDESVEEVESVDTGEEVEPPVGSYDTPVLEPTKTTSRFPEVKPLFGPPPPEESAEVVVESVEIVDLAAVSEPDEVTEADESDEDTGQGISVIDLGETDEPVEQIDTIAPDDPTGEVETVAPDDAFFTEDTHAHLPPSDERVELAAALDAPPSEMPTSQIDTVTQTETAIPPAPYTPPPPPKILPPARITPPPGYYAPSGPDPSLAYLQQRVQAYLHGGYRPHVHAPHEAALSRGKALGVGGWLLALVTIIGFFWYLLILVVSGFQADMVYIVLEADGRVYEDGPGAAHIRRSRSRIGRRWSVFGILIFLVSLVLGAILAAVAGVVSTQERYQAALREAYPAVTLFEEHFSTTQAAPDDVDLVKNGAVAFAILAGIAAVGLWGGATLFVIGTIHASAYRVSVPPLPGYA